VVDRLRTLSAQASMVVVPAALPGLTELVATSYSPVVVVPERDADDGPVVLGAAPWTGDEVFELAFREAAQRRTGLIAVRTRDHAMERARDDLDLALSPWTVIYPGVRVERMVVPDQITALLLDLSTRAQLLVLGRSARGALLGLIVGSPAVDLLGGAQCPVLVVPAAGPPHSTWWPTDLSSRASSGG
jgi:nucleotide-binding universal stress UspA family protein